MNVWILDFEVWPKWWGCILKNAETNEIVDIRNDVDKLKKFINLTIDNSIYVGFNSKTYDDIILRALLIGIDPYNMSHWIIDEGKSPYHFPGFRKAYSIPLMTYDLRNSAIKPVNFGLSLKEYELYKGMSIVESEVDFKKEDLTPEEIDSIMKYCLYDVNATHIMWKEPSQTSNLETRLDIINDFNLDMKKWLNKTDAQVAAEILGAQRVSHNDGDVYDFPSNLELKNKELIDFFSQPLSDDMSLELDIQGIKIKFGIGGTHGAINSYEGNLSHLDDFSSYFPSLIIQYLLMSRSSLSGQDKYKEIYKKRFELKSAGNKKEKSYKLILNIVYGAMDAEFNPLYDTKMRRAIAISGQLFLMDLIEKLEGHIKLIQANTDGILYEPISSQETIDAIEKEWTERTRINMGRDKYCKVFQSDVNNYVFVEEGTNKIKTKGAAVKFYDNRSPYNDNLYIVQKAVVDNLVYGTPIEQTIKNVENLNDYQLAMKKTGKYEGLESNGKLLQKVNRVFAFNDESLDKIWKFRHVDGEKKLAKYTNTPEHAFIYNYDLENTKENLEFFRNNLDFDYYINMATKIAKRYKQKL